MPGNLLDNLVEKCLLRLVALGGALVIGIHESLPEGAGGFREWSAGLRIYRKVG